MQIFNLLGYYNIGEGYIVETEINHLPFDLAHIQTLNKKSPLSKQLECRNRILCKEEKSAGSTTALKTHLSFNGTCQPNHHPKNIHAPFVGARVLRRLVIEIEKTHFLTGLIYFGQQVAGCAWSAFEKGNVICQSHPKNTFRECLTDAGRSQSARELQMTSSYKLEE